MEKLRFERGGTGLSVTHFGGSGPPILLLHGLAGYAGEWSQSAEQLTKDFTVFALDQRGHGDSDRRPHDVSRNALVKDCAETIRRIGLGPVVLVGQSMGSMVAMLTAASHPDLVRVLVMIEGSPDGPEPPLGEGEIIEHFRQTLAGWPVPFRDAQAAKAFFITKGFDSPTWTRGLEQKDDGLWPKWDAVTLAAIMGSLASRTYWHEWGTITKPTLILLGGRGIYPAGHGEELVQKLPGSQSVTVPQAGHDVHLDAPLIWVQALRRFVTSSIK